MAIMAGENSANELLARVLRGFTPEETRTAIEYVTGFNFEEEWEGAASCRAQEIFDTGIGLVDFKINHMLIQLHEEQVEHYSKLAHEMIQEVAEHEATEGCVLSISMLLMEYGEHFAEEMKNQTIDEFKKITQSVLVLAGFGYRTLIVRTHDNKCISSKELLPYGRVKNLLERVR